MREGIQTVGHPGVNIYICGKYVSEHQDEANLSALAVSFNLKSVKVLTPMM